VFSVGESLKPEKNVELGNVPLALASKRVNFFVDYVRLADGTEWGDSTTEEAKELGRSKGIIAARYHQK
jgi:hypothetical protein